MGGKLPLEIALADIRRGMTIRELNGWKRWMRVVMLDPMSGIEGTRSRSARIEYLTGRWKGLRVPVTLTECGTRFERRPPQDIYRRRPEGGWYVIKSDREVGYVIHSATAREWHGFAYWGKRRDHRHVSSHPTRDGARDLLCSILAGRYAGNP
jgi:hypothetical protein